LTSLLPGAIRAKKGKGNSHDRRRLHMGLVLTGGGYQLLGCVSALQKCIRRGLEDQTLYWAAEIETKFPDYLWVRLTVIANEDIGLADPETLGLVQALRQQYFFLRERSKSPSERLPLANAILALCRAKKTRLADDFQAVIYRRREFESWKLDIPDFALDRHTAAGRAKGRGWEHWAKEGTFLAGEVAGMNPYAEEAHRLWETYGPLPKKVKKGQIHTDPSNLELLE